MARELPILMHGESVRGILDGRKTQTRRPVKPTASHWMKWAPETGHTWLVRNGEHTDVRDAAHLCPYGQPGDLLWVREAWAPINTVALMSGRRGQSIVYRAGHRVVRQGYESMPFDERPVKWVDSTWTPDRWRPSIHMPKWAARIWLRVTSVRVERVQNISTEDIIAEGLSTRLREHDAVCALHEQWQQAWDSMHRNKDGLSWDANPWVWAISFEVAEAKT